MLYPAAFRLDTILHLLSTLEDTQQKPFVHKITTTLRLSFTDEIEATRQLQQMLHVQTVYAAPAVGRVEFRNLSYALRSHSCSNSQTSCTTLYSTILN